MGVVEHEMGGKWYGQGHGGVGCNSRGLKLEFGGDIERAMGKQLLVRSSGLGQKRD